ncbi:hypothetical protein ATANTOWER_016665 [Ataeniobius toweri]|uniref:Uncharacterized protein n=1 Tax=Ataeniobius toweri TaxID=208326 RepID=A0ABU7B8E6_9TELE|nr:hypothetical protein [Ataeniobius toweri]
MNGFCTKSKLNYTKPSFTDVDVHSSEESQVSHFYFGSTQDEPVLYFSLQHLIQFSVSEIFSGKHIQGSLFFISIESTPASVCLLPVLLPPRQSLQIRPAQTLQEQRNLFYFNFPTSCKTKNESLSGKDISYFTRTQVQRLWEILFALSHCSICQCGNQAHFKLLTTHTTQTKTSCLENVSRTSCKSSQNKLQEKNDVILFLQAGREKYFL